MCAGCGIPGCGSACGTNDWDTEQSWEGTVTCECGNSEDVEGEATIYGRGNSGTLCFDWTCSECGKANEHQEDWASEDDFDPPEPDDYVDPYDIHLAEVAYERRYDL